MELKGGVNSLTWVQSKSVKYSSIVAYFGTAILYGCCNGVIPARLLEKPVGQRRRREIYRRCERYKRLQGPSNY